MKTIRYTGSALVISTLLASSILSGCGGVPVVNPSPNNTFNTIIAQIDAITVKTCFFLPDMKDLEIILAAGVPGLSLPQDIAKAICTSIIAAQVPTAGGKLGLTVNGLPIIIVNGKPIIVHGTFTK